MKRITNIDELNAFLDRFLTDEEISVKEIPFEEKENVYISILIAVLSTNEKRIYDIRWSENTCEIMGYRCSEFFIKRRKDDLNGKETNT